MLSFTFDSTDTATRSVVGAGAVVVTGLLLWSMLSGKLMILNNIWPWFKETDGFEWLNDTAVPHIAETIEQGRRGAIEGFVSAH